MTQKWIGVDLDGTLAEYHGWSDEIGPPIPAMVERVKQWLAEGNDVRIFTARGTGGGYWHNVNQQAKIVRWCKEHIGHRLPITERKDIYMIALYDDRAISVEFNTGSLRSPAHDSMTFHKGRVAD